MRADGVGGVVQVGYQTAATLGAWRVTHQPQGQLDESSTLDATVLAVDAFWSLQPVSAIVLVVGEITWTWRRLHRYQVDQGRLQAVVLGPPE